MPALEIILLVIFLIFPVIDLVLEKYKSNNKKFEYCKTSAVLWCLTGLVIFFYYQGELSVTHPFILPNTLWKTVFAGTLILLFIIYMIYVMYTIVQSEKIRNDIATSLEHSGDSLNDLMPESRSELFMFTFIVSVTAGVCEELIFRWYLLSVIELHSNWVIAVIGSSMVFGLWHFYLGWKHVIKTALIGLVLCGLYLYFESIFFVILIHILMDVYSGLVAYFARRELPRNAD
ncbi:MULTISPECIES: CPBP family intramembrane glutamic endopeptidase [Pseudoalteromonas]|uniref:CPBP family intramembrane glutamic endopeptidase n=1 Tax=Pseudoalteromonas TaxID=53246 RepID=UPI000783EC02|nr:CPBP family intramembrane glutamic endopeptidase [Pseudoalteromonas arabiensis]MBD58160.1 CPBP family intramembrane metalloprotease [Pseudoalteromonas sp.]|tara:strand:- start:1676 stop:2371 length:696 start_codon:yes stop_codon:yes gene_type:complete